MGTPIKGVIAAKGSVPRSPGRCDTISESKATFAPMSIQAGNKYLWFAVEKSIRAMCGTANPTNEIGPHIAVIAAVSTPVMSNESVRTLRTFTPKFVA